MVTHGTPPVSTAPPQTSPRPAQLGRQGLGVLSSSGLNAVLGIAFWLLAGRYASTTAVALALAAQSWLILLAMGAQLNLGTTLSRFVPVAGAGQRALIGWAYRVSAAGATVLGVAVLVLHASGVTIVSGAGPSLVLVLAASLPLWVAFSMQDSVLVACRRSTWLPWENGLAALLRLVLVLPLAHLAGATGLLLAFVLPAIPLTAVMSWLIARRLALGGEPKPVPGRELLGYALAGFPGSLATMASLRLVPVVVLAVRGPREAAYVGVAWSVVSLSLLTLSALSRALLTELATPGADIDHLLHRVNRMLLRGLLPLCVLGALAATPVLSMAGPGYAERGGPVLLAGILALVPAAATEARLAVLRYQGRPGSATVVQGVRAAVLVLAVLLLAQADQLPWLGAALLGSVVLAWWVASRYPVGPVAGGSGR